MEQLFSALAALQGSALPTALRLSSYGYPLVNAGHIVGIALLFGAIVPLDLRLLGFWPSVPVVSLSRILLPISIVGLMLAVVTGSLLFSVGAVKYAGLGIFQLKMLLVLAATANALLLARVPGWTGDAPERTRGRSRIAFAAGLSIALWLAVILCGRLIAYLD
jgi:hypothetical protein